jgi:hypothetical protein
MLDRQSSQKKGSKNMTLPPGHLTSLMRHFADLRDSKHGGSTSRLDKEAHFKRAVELIGPIAVQALSEINAYLLLNDGEVRATGLERDPDGTLKASWMLTWPEQRSTGVSPLELVAFYGISFHHPHLRGATVHDWPLNVFTASDADDMLPIMRAIATGDLHNVVFQADFRIIPAIMRPPEQLSSL